MNSAVAQVTHKLPFLLLLTAIITLVGCGLTPTKGGGAEITPPIEHTDGRLGKTHNKNERAVATIFVNKAGQVKVRYIDNDGNPTSNQRKPTFKKKCNKPGKHKKNICRVFQGKSKIKSVTQLTIYVSRSIFTVTDYIDGELRQTCYDTKNNWKEISCHAQR